MSRIYVASSWRNEHQPLVVAALRGAGHEVYDFRNPAPGNRGFAWSQIDPAWQAWTTEQYRAALTHPIAASGFAHDVGAMEWATDFCLVLPSGRSAHLEAGWAMGRGKPCSIYSPTLQEPELMYLLAVDEGPPPICATLDEVLAFHRVQLDFAPGDGPR